MEATQVNILIPVSWKNKLERLARKEAVDKDTNVSYLDLMRKAIMNTYNFKDNLEND